MSQTPVSDLAQLTHSSFAARYRYVGELGSGASSRVLAVHDLATDTPCAAKVLDAESGARAIWELETLRRVESPHVVRALELLRVEQALPSPFATPQGAWFLIESRAQGEVSSRAMPDAPEARAAWLRAVTAGVLHGLAAMHGAGLSHGDVKPENVLVDGTHATLIDLGLAEPFGLHAHVSGTPHFLAPEAREGERSTATDLYALGVTMLAWMHGTLLDPLDATKAPPWVPDDLAALARALVHPRIAERPSDAADALRRLGLTTSIVSVRMAWAGPRDAITALGAALDADGVAAIVGPPGSGRSRVVEEAARAKQERIARMGADVPTFVRTRSIPWGLSAPALVHLTEAPTRLQLERFLAATRLRGQVPWVALECDEAPGGMTAVGLAPLAPVDIATLLSAVGGEPASPGAVQAATRATLGYPGRLLRNVALLRASGLDVLRASTWRDATWVTREERPLRPATRDFLAMLAALGGALALDAPEPQVSEAARDAMQQGLASRERDGTMVLSEDRQRSRESDSAQAWARRAASMRARGPATAAIAWHRNQKTVALTLLASFVRHARDEGEPERARELIERFLRVAPEAKVTLALPLSDAWRAEGDVEAASEALRDVATTRDGALALAELLRLQGRLAEAELALQGLTDAETTALRARVAWARGDASGAESLAHEASMSEDPRAILRALETLALLALGRTALEEVESFAARALQVARTVMPIEFARAWEARAISLLAQARQRLGFVAESAAMHAESAALARRAGDRLLDATFSFNAGLAALETGRLGEAISLLEHAALGLTRLGRNAERGRTIANLANAHALVGDESRAAQLVQEALRAEDSDAHATGLALIVRAELLTAQGKLRVATQTLENLTQRRALVATAWARLAPLYALQGDLPQAHRALEAAHPEDARERAELALARARIALDEGNAEAAQRTLAALPSALDFECQCRALALSVDVHDALRHTEQKAQALTQLRALVEPALRALPPLLQGRFRQLPTIRRALAEGGVHGSGDAERSLRQALDGAVRVAGRATWRSTLSELAETALRVAAAERAFVVSWADGKAQVIARAGAADEQARPSTSLVLRALRERIVNTSDAIASGDASASVHALALRSVLAVRLATRGQGDEARTSYVLAVDDRLRPSAFDAHVTESLRALADVCGPILESRLEARQLRREVKSQLAQVESLAGENARQRERMRGLGQGDAFSDFVHASASTKTLVRDARRLARSSLSVLITGETGTGKSLLARCIHLESERRHAPFVVEEGGAFSSDLLESTLFGHVRGAFTGADRARQGLFELANGGTLFLDGIDEAPLAVQAKLLRVLVEGVVRPMGSEREKRVDVRVIATLRHASEDRVPARLREDLYYRVAGATLSIAPLRTRIEDLSALIEARVQPDHLSHAAMRVLMEHTWPGNVRELEHVLSQARLFAAGQVIEAAHLPLEATPSKPDLHQLRGALTRELVVGALERNRQNRTRAARELGISRFGLQKILKRMQDEGGIQEK